MGQPLLKPIVKPIENSLVNKTYSDSIEEQKGALDFDEVVAPVLAVDDNQFNVYAVEAMVES